MKENDNKINFGAKFTDKPQYEQRIANDFYSLLGCVVVIFTCLV